MTEQKSGFLLIDKPAGWTSFDVVAKLRGLTGIRKIGHAGTLDPFATGLLIVAVGREATKRISEFVKLDKEYIAVLRLGAHSDSFDSDGNIININSAQDPGREKVEAIVKKFIGAQKQIPPMFSAKKINGRKLYELARQGRTVERKPADIVVYRAEIINFAWPNLEIRFCVSSGTYIRALARDIGRALGTGAYLSVLKRTKIGLFQIEEASRLADLDKGNWTKKLFRAD